MKKSLLLIPALLLFILSCFTLNAQVQEWQNIQNFPDSRSGAISFVIGDTAYVGTGYNGTSHLNSFYKYNADDGNWRSVSNFPGVARKNAVAFVVGGKAYVGTGTDGTIQLKDFYEYDPSTGNWSPISDLPGEIRNQASSFSINNKGYVGLGGNDTGSLSDFYEYDLATASWRSIASLPESEARSRAIGFSAIGKGFITSGVGNIQFTGMYSYDPTTDSWTQEIFADSKLSSLQQNTVYKDNEGLVHILKSGFTQEQVIIDPLDNTLTIADAYFADERDAGVAFLLNGEAYAGIGLINDEFGDAIEKNSFQKLVTIYPPEAPTNLYKANSSGTQIRWHDNSDNEEGFIVYLSEGDNENYQKVDTVPAGYQYFTFDTLKQGVRQYIKVAAYNRAGIAESNEITYYPEYNTGKVVTPELLSVSEDQADSSGIKMVFKYINRDGPGNAELERSNDGVNFETAFRKSTGQSDSLTIIYNPVFNENSDELFYRMKMRIEGRQDSDYSNIITFDTDELKPLAPELSYKVREYTSGLLSSTFKYELSFSGYNHADSIAFYGIMDDSINFVKIFRNLRGSGVFGFDLYVNDSIQILAVNQNVFGSDTSKILITSPLRRPRLGSKVESNNQAVSFDYFSPVVADELYTIVERAKGEGGYAILDSVKESDSYTYVGYNDLTVEPNTNYRYRLKSVNSRNTSLYSEVLQIKTEKKVSWPEFRKQSLGALLDSISTYSVRNIDVFQDKIFFISANTQAAFYFDLHADELVALPELPSAEKELSHFTKVEELNNKIYYFTPITEDEEKIKSVYILDLQTESWSVENIDNISQVKYVIPLSDDQFLTLLEKEDGSEGGIFSIYNTNTNGLTFTDLTVDTEVTYIYNGTDSITVFDSEKNVYSTNTNFTNLNFINTTEYPLYKELITEYKNELVQVINKGLYKIDLSEAPFLFRTEAVETDANYRNRKLFNFNDQLIYHRGYDRVFNAIDKFHYRNPNVPENIVGLQVSSLGYENIDVKWVDAANESYYVVELLERNNFFIFKADLIKTDTITANSTSFSYENLKEGDKYYVKVYAGNENGLGEAAGLILETLDAPVPDELDTVMLNQISTDSLQVSWELARMWGADSVDIRIYQELGPSKQYKIEVDTLIQSVHLPVERENQKIYANIRAFNKWNTGRSKSGNTITTRLFPPEIKEIKFYEKEEKYIISFTRNSSFTNAFELYRKSATDLDFKLVTTIENIQSNSYEMEDFVDDVNIEYEYRMKGLLVESDTIQNSSYFSEAVSTGSSILSNSILQSGDLSIFPNPVNNRINISSDKNIQLQYVEVFSLTGRQIEFYEASESIDVSKLDKGIYLIRIKAKSGEVIKRFIKE